MTGDLYSVSLLQYNVIRTCLPKIASDISTLSSTIRNSSSGIENKLSALTSAFDSIKPLDNSLTGMAKGFDSFLTTFKTFPKGIEQLATPLNAMVSGIETLLVKTDRLIETTALVGELTINTMSKPSPSFMKDLTGGAKVGPFHKAISDLIANISKQPSNLSMMYSYSEPGSLIRPPGTGLKNPKLQSIPLQTNRYSVPALQRIDYQKRLHQL
jgi:hypothetical protein